MSVPAVKSAQLCWGQRYHWLRYQQVPPGYRHDAHIVANCQLPEGISLAELRAGLNYLIRRHEALRTVYDASARPWPQQRVQAPGPLHLSVASTEADGTPAPAEIVAELSVTDFDLSTEWPIRACVVTTDGRPRRLVMVLNHIAFDDWSLTTFRGEFEAVLAAAASHRRAALPPVVDQPCDLARYETARAHTESRPSLEHWHAELATLPADGFAGRRVQAGDVPEGHSASLTSPSLLAAGRTIAAREQVWPSAVHLAGYAVLMAAYTGQNLIAYRWLTSHREGSGHLTVMTCMFSPTLVSLALDDDPPFREVVRRTAARVEQAQANAHVAYDEVLEAMAREGVRRGEPVRAAPDVNFLSYAPRSCGTRRERFTWNPAPTAWARAGSDAYFRIHEWQDGVTAALLASGNVMSAAVLERFLRSYARLLDLHGDPAVDLRVSAVARLAGFPAPPLRATARIGPDAVDLGAIEAMLGTHSAVEGVQVSATERGLVADVNARGPVTPAALRAHTRAHVHDYPGARCPAWFRITAAGRVVEGEGSESSHLPGTESELALASAIADVNGVGPIELADCYVGSGGRILCAPAVLATLRERGWQGISLGQLLGTQPLLSLAAELRRHGPGVAASGPQSALGGEAASGLDTGLEAAHRVEVA